jgi:hypothetical protein
MGDYSFNIGDREIKGAWSYPKENMVEDRIIQLLIKIRANYLPDLTWEIAHPQLGGYSFIYISLNEITKHMLGLITDLNKWDEEMIINHTYAVLRIDRPKGKTKMVITKEQKETAYEDGVQTAEVWMPALNPDMSTDSRQQLALWFAKYSGYELTELSFAFVKGFSSATPKKTFIDRVGKINNTEVETY